MASAVSTLAETLRTADDLSKLSSLGRKIKSELVSVEAKLRESSKESLTSTRYGLNALVDSRVTVQQVREQLVNIERLNEDPRTRVEGFERLAEVSKIHKNFVTTLEMVDNLQDMYDKIDALEAMIKEEQAHPWGPQPNLLAIHYRLTQLEAFRNETLHQAKRTADDATIATLDKYFSRLAGLLSSFEEHYLGLALRLVELTRKGQSQVAVKIAKIAEVEGSRDEKAIAIRLVKKKGAEVASRFKSLQADARVIKHYRAKVVDAIKQGARNRLKARRDSTDSMMGFIGDMDFFYQDLVKIEDKLVPCFPPDWKIYNTFVKAYHMALYDMFKIYVASDEADAASLLALAQYTKTYNDVMTKDLELSPDLLEPPLLDGKQQELVDDYMKLIIRKMDEWMSNLQRTEQADFVTRENPPEEDADGMYGMQGAGILFQMINSQCDLAAESGKGQILARVVEESNRVMRQLQSSWMALVDQEMKKQLTSGTAAPEELAPGLVEYIMALANDQVKSANFVETLLNRLEPLVSDKYRVVIVDKLNDAMDGFLDVAKKCIQVLIEVVFNDLKPATKVLFQSNWYTDDPTLQIVETISDYVQDFNAHLNPSLFELLIDDTIDTFLINYLLALRKASKLKQPAAGNRMREDIRRAFEFFLQFKQPRADLESQFNVLDALHKIVTASKTLFYLDYRPFAKRYGANIQFVESVLKARDDLDRKSVSEIMDAIKSKVQDEELPDPAESIFSRLPAGKGYLGFVGL